MSPHTVQWTVGSSKLFSQTDQYEQTLTAHRLPCMAPIWYHQVAQFQ